MLSLLKYIEQKNRWKVMVKGQPYEIQTAKGCQEVADCLDGDLSPERLTCDGELSRSQVNIRYKSLMTAATQLQKLDPTVKFYEFA